MATPANDIWEQVKAIQTDHARLQSELTAAQAAHAAWRAASIEVVHDAGNVQHFHAWHVRKLVALIAADNPGEPLLDRLAAVEKERDELRAEVARLKARLQYAARHNEILRAEPARIKAAMEAVNALDLPNGPAMKDRLLAAFDTPAEPQPVAVAEPVEVPHEPPEWPPIMVERQPHQTLIDKARLAELEACEADAKRWRKCAAAKQFPYEAIGCEWRCADDDREYTTPEAAADAAGGAK